jgi:FtsH-binding integral membrane protein
LKVKQALPVAAVCALALLVTAGVACLAGFVTWDSLSSAPFSAPAPLAGLVFAAGLGLIIISRRRT